MKRDECMDKIKRLIPDENVRRLIFSDDWDTNYFINNRDDILKYYSTITALAFAYLYGGFRDWNDNNPSSLKGGSNSHRVVNTLKKMYSEYDLTYELMESLIMDVFIDQSEKGSKLLKGLKIYEIIKAEDKRSDLSKYYYNARKYRRGPRDSRKLMENATVASRREELVNLIALFPFLGFLHFKEKLIPNVFCGVDENGPREFKDIYEISLVYDNFRYVSEERETCLHSTVIKLSGNYYFLDGMEEISEGVLHLNYTSLSDLNDAIEIIVENEDDNKNNDIMTIRGDGVAETYKQEIAPVEYEGNEQTSNTKEIYAVNYKYVKNLSLSIADVLTESLKDALMREYMKYYESIFKPINKKKDLHDVNNYNWDNIVGLLIIEDSASNILKTIFYADGEECESCKKILENLQIRFGSDRLDATAVMTSIENREKNITRWEKILISDGRKHNKATEGIRDNRKKNKSEMAALAIVDALSTVSNNKGRTILSENPSFPMRMEGRIKFIEDLKISSAETNVKKESLIKLVKQTLRALICFYKGFFKYAEIKGFFEIESYYKCLSGKKIKEAQMSAENAFMVAVNESVAMLTMPEKDNIGSLLEEVEELCHRCRTRSGQQTTEGKLLKDTLGRNMLLHYDHISDLGRIIDRAEGKDEVLNAIDAAIAAFNYLMTGNIGNSQEKNRAIYPYVLTYESSGRNRDGYNIGNYSYVVGKEEMEIKVLSEFDYVVNEKYFCLPNIIRSNESFWIEPIIIGFVNFDKLMMGEEYNEGTEDRQDNL